MRRIYAKNEPSLQQKDEKGAPVRSPEVFGLTIPLLVDAQGNKYGKTMENGRALWLDPAKTPPFEFYQFFVNIADDQVKSLLQKLTFIPLDEIDVIMERHETKPEERMA